MSTPFELDMGLVDSDPVLGALCLALNLQAGIKYYTDRPAGEGLDGEYHFARIREAIRLRQGELTREGGAS